MAKTKQSKAKAWRNRIVRRADVDPEQLLANPQNFRIHSHLQEQAMGSVLDDIGWVRTVLVNQRTGHVVDGHMRVLLAIQKGAPTVPVDYVDLSLKEERIVLATHDPIAAMAGTDNAKLGELIEDVTAQASANVKAALSELHGTTQRASPVDRVAPQTCPTCGRAIRQS